MAPLAPVAGVVRHVLEGTNGSRNWANVFHVQYTGDLPSVPSLNGMAGEINTALSSGLAAYMHEDTTIVQSVSTDLSSDTGNQVVSSILVPGTLDAAPLPSSAAFLVNYNSSFRYRGGHPRSYYILGDTASLLNSQTWTAAFFDNVAGAVDAISLAFAAGSIDGTNYIGQCAVSYYKDKVLRVAPLVMPIAAAFPSNLVATQRRRMRKG
jgi:hypothetical protein